MNIILADGKYEYHCKDGRQYALRNGEPWRDLNGDNLIYYMAERIEQLERQRDELLARIDVVCEVHIISQTYDRIREERRFAADDIEYDLFAAGWKAAIASVKEKQCK